MSRTLTRAGTLAAVGLTALALVACSAPKKDSSGSSGSAAAGGGAATATSAAGLGGLAGLEAAAKKEGALNVIALPPDWANYGQILKDFAAKYPEIKITSSQPDAGSADEISAAQRLKGQSTAPDVFDLGPAVAQANTGMFAPYKVADFDKVPTQFKDPNGLWINDYGGLMTVGYDSAKVPAPTSLADLLKPEYRGKVALNGDPIKAGAAFAGVQMVAIAEGGSPEDPTKGIEWFGKLKDAGNFLPVDPTPATIESGQTPVVFDWSYNQVGVIPKLSTWKMWTPPSANLMTYYVQAINKEAPHPAAARLWEEYLYSASGQNAWLKGGAKPVLFDEMDKGGTVDKAAAAALPRVTTPVIPTSAETDKAKAILAKEWANAIG